MREEAQAKIRGDVNTLVVPAMADLTLDRPHIWKYLPDQQRKQILLEEQEAKQDNQVSLRLILLHSFFYSDKLNCDAKSKKSGIASLLPLLKRRNFWRRKNSAYRKKRLSRLPRKTCAKLKRIANVSIT